MINKTNSVIPTVLTNSILPQAQGPDMKFSLGLGDPKTINWDEIIPKTPEYSLRNTNQDNYDNQAKLARIINLSRIQDIQPEAIPSSRFSLSQPNYLTNNRINPLNPNNISNNQSYTMPGTSFQRYSLQ